MKEAELQAVLADCFEVRLKPDRLAHVYELLRAEYSILTPYRFSQEVDLGWATIWRILNGKSEGIHETTLRKFEDFAMPYLARACARGMDTKELAGLILHSDSLEEDLVERLQ